MEVRLRSHEMEAAASYRAPARQQQQQQQALSAADLRPRPDASKGGGGEASEVMASIASLRDRQQQYIVAAGSD